MKYLIFGTGALGSVFGAFLQRSGCQVAFFGKGRHFDMVKTQGLRVTGIWGDFSLPKVTIVSETPVISEKFDVILLCVKSSDTNTATRQAIPFLQSNGLIISIQNGLNNVETIAQFAGKSRTIGARVIFGAEIPEPGMAKVTVYADKVLLGNPFGETNSSLLQQVETDLNKAQIPTAIVNNIMAFIWGKVLYNGALNPLGAILDVNYGKLGDNEETRLIMKEIIREMFLVIHKKEIAVPYKDADEYYRFLLDRQLPPTYNHRSSMLQDLKAGRITEIDAINGAIVNYAKDLGIVVPYNDMITQLIKFKQKKN